MRHDGRIDEGTGIVDEVRTKEGLAQDDRWHDASQYHSEEQME